jgi:hypothetical protein
MHCPVKRLGVLKPLLLDIGIVWAWGIRKTGAAALTPTLKYGLETQFKSELPSRCSPLFVPFSTHFKPMTGIVVLAEGDYSNIILGNFTHM